MKSSIESDDGRRYVVCRIIVSKYFVNLDKCVKCGWYCLPDEVCSCVCDCERCE
jgi:hypothetical protein